MSQLAFLRSKGATKIGVMGFCYGGHPACWAASENEDVAAGVVLHPSMQLETFAFGGKCEELLSQVRCPFMLCPAGNDIPMWAVDGEFCQAFKQAPKGADFDHQLFREMAHGWSLRGDLSDDNVKRDVDSVMAAAKTFFAKHLA